MSGLPFVCSACRRSQLVPDPVAGRIPACSACQAPLALPAPAVYHCPACSVRSKPTKADPNQARPCPKCGKPFAIIAAQATAATVVTGAPLPEIDPGDRPAAAALPEIDHGGQAVAESRIAGGALPAGASFGRYRIERELARGGMGIVYIAQDPVLKRRLALKVMIAGEMADDDSIRRFVREARSAGQLRHPNIIAVHEAGEQDGRHFFTMDLVDGAELGKWAAERPLREAVAAMRAVCAALHHAHEHGVIHRDLKPANIMVEKDGRPVLMDFGLAKDVSGNASFRSLSGMIAGTPAYMSPEQAQGRQSEIDRRTDVYACGVILYELATGRRPFGGETMYDTIHAVLHDEPRPPLGLSAEVDPGLNAVILRCLEKDPARRYPTSQELADELGRWLEGDAVQARGPGAAQQAWRRLRARPRLLAGLAAGAVAALALLVVLLVTFGGASWLDRAATAFASREPERMRSAVATVAGQFAEGGVKLADRARALALLREASACGDAEAEAAADKALLALKDGESAPALAALACDPATAPARAERALATLAALGPDCGDAAGVARSLADAAAKTADPPRCEALAATAIAIDPPDASERISALAVEASRPSAQRVALLHAMGRSHTAMVGPASQRLLRAAGDPDQAIGDAAAAAMNALRSQEAVFNDYGFGIKAGNAVASAAAANKAAADNQRRLQAMADEMDGDTPAARAGPAEAAAKRLKDPSAEVRMAATYDLGRIGGSAAIAPLTAALADSDAGVRRMAGRSLAAVAVATAVPLPPITSLLGSPDAGLRAAAARALADLQAREAVPALVAAFATEREAKVRVALVEALGACRSDDALPALREAMTGADPALALACVQAFGTAKAHDGKALPDLVAALASADRAVREAAGAQLAAATGTDLGTDQSRWQAWLAGPH